MFIRDDLTEAIKGAVPFEVHAHSTQPSLSSQWGNQEEIVKVLRTAKKSPAWRGVFLQRDARFLLGLVSRNHLVKLRSSQQVAQKIHAFGAHGQQLGFVGGDLFDQDFAFIIGIQGEHRCTQFCA